MAGDHAAPVNWLERWRDTEPLRLYLYGITVPVLGACLAYGWVTQEQMGAWLAVAAALFLGSTMAGELARRVAWAPQSVGLALDEQHQDSYAQGVEDAVHSATPETVAMTRVRACTEVKEGRRCTLPIHPASVSHHYG
jgi:hypothetical protein